jgi:hypothetical protein
MSAEGMARARAIIRARLSRNLLKLGLSPEAFEALLDSQTERCLNPEAEAPRGGPQPVRAARDRKNKFFESANSAKFRKPA